MNKLKYIHYLSSVEMLTGTILKKELYQEVAALLGHQIWVIIFKLYYYSVEVM